MLANSIIDDSIKSDFWPHVGLPTFDAETEVIGSNFG